MLKCFGNTAFSGLWMMFPPHHKSILALLFIYCYGLYYNGIKTIFFPRGSYGATSSNAQGLLQAQHSGITLDNAQETFWDAGNRTQASRMQGRHLLSLLSLWPQHIKS